MENLTNLNTLSKRYVYTECQMYATQERCIRIMNCEGKRSPLHLMNSGAVSWTIKLHPSLKCCYSFKAGIESE